MECFLTYGLLMISKEKSPEVFIEEEVSRMIGRLAHWELLQVLTDRVLLGVCEFKQEGCIGGGTLRVDGKLEVIWLEVLRGRV